MIREPIDVLNAPVYDFPLEEDIAAMVETIRKSCPTDPVVLALEAVEIFVHLSGKYYLERPLELNIDIRGLCRALVRAQPACAPLIWLANEMLKPLENFYAHGEGERMRADMRARAEALREEILTHERQRVFRAAQLVRPGTRVVCHGFSTEIVDALREARSAGINFWTSCIKGIRWEGRVLAQELTRYGIPARVDSARDASAGLSDAALMLAGAYALGEQGLLYRAETGALADAAQASHVPCYALCGRDKFFPAGYPSDLYMPLPPEQEWVPLEAWTGVITDQAILSPEQARAEWARHPLQSLLLG